MSPNFKNFLIKSKEFHEAIIRKIQTIPFTPETEFRVLATLIMTDISSEHYQSIHLIMENDCFISATSLLRLQYESLLRATWIYWCASNELIEKLHAPLTENKVKNVEKHMPTINHILEDLSQAAALGKISQQHLKLLKEFKDTHLRPTNSYVHSGTHAFSRKKEGFFEPMMIQILQNSNGLESLNALLLGTMTHDEEIVKYIISMQYIYFDCLPMQIPEIIKRFY